MRLIDANKLLSYITSVINCGLGKKKSLEYISKYIESIPTAFDLDKVVQQLEEHSMIGYVPLGVATKIVRRGGAE